MAIFSEPLESRTLFAAATIPTATAESYAALIQDDAKLKADVKTYTTPLAADVKLLATEVKALGKNPTNTALLNEIKKDSALVVSGDAAATAKYVSIANAAFRKMELAIAAFSAKPNVANGHKLVAQDNVCVALETPFEDPRFEPLIDKASNAADDMFTTLDTLSADNPTATQLAAGVQAVNTDLSNISNNQGGDADTATAAIQTLLSS